jgi:hypothetical protein
VNDRSRPKAAPGKATTSLSDLNSMVEQTRRRVLVDALAEATSDYWLRRADQFAAVGTPECDMIARNCRVHASLMPANVRDVAELLEELT